MEGIYSELVGIKIDAQPQRPQFNINENIINSKFSIESLIDDFTKEDFKSAFFLLMDDVGTKNFISLTNQDLPYLKAEFIKISRSFKDETILIELFGTLKMYYKLKSFKSCHHVFESKMHTFDKIRGIWKVLYMLCEEMADGDVEILKETVPENFKNHIQSAEDWFCWALNENIFSTTNLIPLETHFKRYPSWLHIVKSLTDFEMYRLQVPSSSSSCGIALILNYEKFNENPNLEKRDNSDKDVGALEKLWKTFGFKIQTHTNKTYSETLKIMRDCSLTDHSNFDAFVCCILSHGRSNAVFSSDGHLMELSELTTPIMNDCLTLENKPKLFFIQACQGTYVHQGVGKKVYNIPEKTVTAHTAPPPIQMDTVISMSSIEGYVSFRDEKGSWFIQTFCKIMEEYGDTSTIEEVLRILQDDIPNKFSANFGPSGPNKALQMPFYRSTLRKKLIFKKCSD